MTFVMPHPSANPYNLSLSKKVENSVAAMDAVLPDWRSKIDVSKFDIISPNHCILGQAFSTPYFRTVEIVRPELDGLTFDDRHFMFWSAQKEWLKVLATPAPVEVRPLSDRLRSIVAEMREAGYTVNVNFIAPAETVTL